MDRAAADSAIGLGLGVCSSVSSGAHPGSLGGAFPRTSRSKGVQRTARLRDRCGRVRDEVPEDVRPCAVPHDPRADRGDAVLVMHDVMLCFKDDLRLSESMPSSQQIKNLKLAR
jgi:hypothetical protein